MRRQRRHRERGRDDQRRPGRGAAVKPNATMNSGTSTMPPPLASRPRRDPRPRRTATTKRRAVDPRVTRAVGPGANRYQHPHPDDDEQRARREQEELVAHDARQQRADDHRRHRRQHRELRTPGGRARRPAGTAERRASRRGASRAAVTRPRSVPGPPSAPSTGVAKAEPPAPNSPKANPMPMPARTTGTAARPHRPPGSSRSPRRSSCELHRLYLWISDGSACSSRWSTTAA